MSVAPKPAGPMRRGVRRLAGIATLALAPLLLLQLGVAWLIHDGAEMQVPDFVADLIRPHLEKAGLTCSWSSARVSLSGRIELLDASVGAAGGTDPVFEAGRLTAVLDPFDLILAQRITPARLWLDRGKLLCPASISPTGRREVALDRIRAALHREGDRLVIDTLQADCGGIPLVAHGRVLPPRTAKHDPAKPAASSGFENPLRAPGIAAARLVAVRPWLSRLGNASLELVGEDTPAGVRLRLTGLAESLAIPEEGVRADNLHLGFGLLWDKTGPHPDADATFGFSSLTVERAAGDGLPALHASCGSAALRTAFGHEWELPTTAHLAAHRPDLNGLALDRITLDLDRLAEKRLHLKAAVNWRREVAGVSALVDIAAGTVEADFRARIRPNVALTHPAAPKPADFPAELAGLSVPGLLDASGHVVFSPGWKFLAADLTAETGALRIHKIDAQSVRLAAHITPDNLTLSRVELQSADQHAVASVDCGYNADSHYRVIVKANAYPDQITPFVGKWWTHIWEDLALTPGHPATIDIDVSGQWEGLPYEHIFGAFSAEKLAYRKQVFDHVRVNILEEPPPSRLLCLYDLRMRNNDGTHARGRLQWQHAAPHHDLEACRFAFTGRLLKDVGVQLAGDEVVAALTELKVPTPAEGEVIGCYHGPASSTPNREQLEVRVTSTGAFEAWKLPAENFTGVVTLDGKRLEIRDAALRYAGGATTGHAWIHLDPAAFRLTFDAAFKDCDRDKFFAGIAAMKESPPPAKIGKPDPAKPAPDPASPVVPARLSGDIRARVKLNDVATLDGRGHAIINDVAMPAVPMLGAFSRGLESMGVSAATYRFDTVDGEYFIRDSVVWLPDLKVRGGDAVVDVRGKYTIGPGDIVFRALLNLKRADSIPLLSWAKNLVTSSTRLFPVDVTGTLDEPKWSVDPTPSALITKQRNDSLGLPPPPKPDDGRW